MTIVGAIHPQKPKSEEKEEKKKRKGGTVTISVAFLPGIAFNAMA